MLWRSDSAHSKTNLASSYLNDRGMLAVQFLAVSIRFRVGAVESLVNGLARWRAEPAASAWLLVLAADQQLLLRLIPVIPELRRWEAPLPSWYFFVALSTYSDQIAIACTQNLVNIYSF